MHNELKDAYTLLCDEIDRREEVEREAGRAYKNYLIQKYKGLGLLELQRLEVPSGC